MNKLLKECLAKTLTFESLEDQVLGQELDSETSTLLNPPGSEITPPADGETTAVAEDVVADVVETTDAVADTVESTDVVADSTEVVEAAAAEGVDEAGATDAAAADVAADTAVDGLSTDTADTTVTDAVVDVVDTATTDAVDGTAEVVDTEASAEVVGGIGEGVVDTTGASPDAAGLTENMGTVVTPAPDVDLDGIVGDEVEQIEETIGEADAAYEEGEGFTEAADELKEASLSMEQLYVDILLIQKKDGHLSRTDAYQVNHRANDILKRVGSTMPKMPTLESFGAEVDAKASTQLTLEAIAAENGGLLKRLIEAAKQAFKNFKMFFEKLFNTTTGMRRTVAAQNAKLKKASSNSNGAERRAVFKLKTGLVSTFRAMGNNGTSPVSSKMVLDGLGAVGADCKKASDMIRDEAKKAFTEQTKVYTDLSKGTVPNTSPAPADKVLTTLPFNKVVEYKGGVIALGEGDLEVTGGEEELSVSVKDVENILRRTFALIKLIEDLQTTVKSIASEEEKALNAASKLMVDAASGKLDKTKVAVRLNSEIRNLQKPYNQVLGKVANLVKTGALAGISVSEKALNVWAGAK